MASALTVLTSRCVGKIGEARILQRDQAHEHVAVIGLAAVLLLA